MLRELLCIIVIWKQNCPAKAIVLFLTIASFTYW